MSFFKKLLGTPEPPAPVAEASPANDSCPVSGPEWDRQAAHFRAHGSFEPSGLLGCEGIDWNESVQLAFLNETLPEWHEPIAALPAEWTSGWQRDAAVLFSMISAHQPTRLMQVGCGASTYVIRAAVGHQNLPCEVIAIDSNPGMDVTEVTDAHLDQPVQEIPLSDFEMLRDGEMLVLETSHVFFPGGDVEYLYQRVLPRLNSGVIVGIQGVRLPRHYSREELARGFGEQALLQMFLTGNARVEVLYAGGWLAEHHGGEPSRALWFRVNN